MAERYNWLDCVDYVAWDLDLRSKVIEADVRDLAWVWEEAVDKISWPTAEGIFYMLRTATRSYLRGRGLQMGNMQGWERHGLTETVLQLCLIQYVINEGRVVFDALHRVGLSSVERHLGRLRRDAMNSVNKEKKGPDVLDQVKRMLGEGGEL